jgi:hypothetical protein
MSDNMTAAEIEQQHLTLLGPSLGPVYHALHNEVTSLHEKWLEYRKLYATSSERLDLLNQTAGFFFRVVQDVLWDDVLLHITRLTDDPGTGEEERLVLSRLKGHDIDTPLASELRTLLRVAYSRAEFAREERNRRIAHTDLALAINAKAEPLSGGTRQVEDVLSSFRDVLNAIHKRYLGGECGFEHVLVVSDAETLLRHLKFALRSERQRMERHMCGRAVPEDHEPFPSV